MVGYSAEESVDLRDAQRLKAHTTSLLLDTMLSVELAGLDAGRELDLDSLLAEVTLSDQGRQALELPPVADPACSGNAEVRDHGS